MASNGQLNLWRATGVVFIGSFPLDVALLEDRVFAKNIGWASSPPALLEQPSELIQPGPRTDTSASVRIQHLVQPDAFKAPGATAGFTGSR